MSYENVKLWFAKDENSEIVTVNDITKEDQSKNSKYYCPVCGSDLKPKAIESKRVTPHFAHVDASKCNSETMIHWWFKHKFLEVGDKFTIASNIEKEYICKDFLVEEPHKTSDGEYRPDMTILTECGNTIYFEFNYSNRKRVKDYLDMWLELKNIVVEVDIKQLMLQGEVPKFKALFYNGKCFNTKRNDTYYNTIGKYKEEKLNGKVDEKLKERIKKLDWFWDDVFRYKKGEIDIDHMVDVIDAVDEKDNDLLLKILNKQSCVELFKDYLKQKQDRLFIQLNEKINFIPNRYWIEKTGLSFSWRNKYDTRKIRLHAKNDVLRSYDILAYSIESILESIKNEINTIIRNEESDDNKRYAKENPVLLDTIKSIEKYYQRIDSEYRFYDRFGYSANVTFYYGSYEKIDFSLPREIINSNDKEFIWKYFTKEIDGYINSTGFFNDKKLLNKSLDDLDNVCKNINFDYCYKEKDKKKYGKWIYKINKRNISYSLDYKFHSTEIAEIGVKRSFYNYPGNLDKTICIYKNKLYFCRYVDYNENVVDSKLIKNIDNYYTDLKNTVLNMISQDMKINCKDCNGEFSMESGEIDFFTKNGLSVPKRCKSCRNKRKQQKLNK